MKIADTYSFDADQQTVWDLLLDPSAIAQALPGVDCLVPIDGETNAWEVTVRIGIAVVCGTYTGTVRITDIVPPDHYRMTVGGKGQGSIIGGSALLTLAYDPEQNKTLVAWTADTNVSGRLAGVGQRVTAAAASMLAQQFFRALAHQLAGAGTRGAKQQQGGAKNT